MKWIVPARITPAHTTRAFTQRRDYTTTLHLYVASQKKPLFTPLTNCKCLALETRSDTMKVTKLAAKKENAKIMKRETESARPWSRVSSCFCDAVKGSGWFTV